MLCEELLCVCRSFDALTLVLMTGGGVKHESACQIRPVDLWRTGADASMSGMRLHLQRLPFQPYSSRTRRCRARRRNPCSEGGRSLIVY